MDWLWKHTTQDELPPQWAFCHSCLSSQTLEDITTSLLISVAKLAASTRISYIPIPGKPTSLDTSSRRLRTAPGLGCAELNEGCHQRSEHRLDGMRDLARRLAPNTFPSITYIQHANRFAADNTSHALVYVGRRRSQPINLSLTLLVVAWQLRLCFLSSMRPTSLHLLLLHAKYFHFGWSVDVLTHFWKLCCICFACWLDVVYCNVGAWKNFLILLVSC